MSMFPSLIAQGKASQLDCPDCAVKLLPFSCGGIPIFKCDCCQGIWFDDRRIGRFKKILDSFDLTKIIEFFQLPEDNRIQISVCPRCDQALDDFRYGYNSGVLLKRCHSCEGLWSPLQQTIKIIQSAKISQEIAEDVKGLSFELEKIQHEKKMFEGLQIVKKRWMREK